MYKKQLTYLSHTSGVDGSDFIVHKVHTQISISKDSNYHPKQLQYLLLKEILSSLS